jgi:hypothetical protein
MSPQHQVSHQMSMTLAEAAAAVIKNDDDEGYEMAQE